MGNNWSDEKRAEIEEREENINRYKKNIYMSFTDTELKKIADDKKKDELKKLELIEKRKLERIKSKKRYIRENFLGDYPKDVINREFIYNDKFTDSFDHGIPRLFIDFSVGVKNVLR